jgi:hypothetical protein
MHIHQEIVYEFNTKKSCFPLTEPVPIFTDGQASIIDFLIILPVLLTEM